MEATKTPTLIPRTPNSPSASSSSGSTRKRARAPSNLYSPIIINKPCYYANRSFCVERSPDNRHFFSEIDTKYNNSEIGHNTSYCMIGLKSYTRSYLAMQKKMCMSTILSHHPNKTYYLYSATRPHSTYLFFEPVYFFIYAYASIQAFTVIFLLP